MKVFAGTLRIGQTLWIGAIATWVWNCLVGICLAAFGVIHYKWIILLLAAPIIIVVTCIMVTILVLLVLGFSGRIPSDIDQYKNNQEVRGD